MWIVQLALRRKFTFVVMSMFIALLGILTCFRTPIDIFPVIDVPVVSVIWSYGGLSPEDMEKRIVTTNERAMTTTVNDIEHIESQSLPGVAVVKVFFQPNASATAGVAQVTAICQTLLRAFPPGTTPPLILQYSASNVPVVQLGVGSKSLSEQQLYDLSTNNIRTAMVTQQGVSIPLPYGGKPRQVSVDLDIPALLAKGLSPSDVGNAIGAGNIILPAGTVKIGTKEVYIHLNSQPSVIDDLNNIPIRVANGAPIYVRDVAYVHDGNAVQSNIVNQDGKRAALITILKSGQASTLDVVNRVKSVLPHVRTLVPPELDLHLLFDQSVFVKASVEGVIREAVIAACLTALMILLFLGSWRSTLVVASSIPLSILSSLTILGALGQTINIMTLGGLSLAVGILVDDATVEIENTNRNLAMGGKSLTRAILDGANQIAVPTLVATLSICIVFIPVAFLSGTAKYLFTPLALAVVFAMMSSYLLSRTLVPVMVQFLLPKDIERIVAEEAGQKHTCDDELPEEEDNKQDARHKAQDTGKEDSKDEGKKDADQNPKSKIQNSKSGIGAHIDGFIWGIHHRFNHLFENFRDRYCTALTWALTHRLIVGVLFAVFFLLSSCLLPFVGRDFFPRVDAGQIRLHIKALPGTRLEETEHLFFQVESVVRKTIPKDEIETVIDNIGLPVGGVNLAFSDASTIGALDGDMLISLKEGKHGPTDAYTRALRRNLNHEFPDANFQFLPADITTQILNFGLPAPIDIQVVGRDPSNYSIALQIAQKVRAIPGAVDVDVHQIVNAPQVNVNVDRIKAGLIGLTERDAANNLLLSLTGNGQSAPSFFVDPKTGVSYGVNLQTPQREIRSVEDLANTPILPSTTTAPQVSAASAPTPQLLSNLADFQHTRTPQVINHYNVQPIYDIYVSTEGRDLGGVSSDVDKALDSFRKHLPRGTTLDIRGQVNSMNSSFLGLGLGMILAVALVYLLMVVNFQSWVDPLIIIMALPGAASGILWSLFITHTTFSVPSLMGSIMSIGVATSNSILLVTFANERRVEGDTALQAAQAAGFTRLRPVLMTALALILGMLPMALGLGEGGEQNAPLGRAVIGGSTLATVTTLFLVPIIYSLLRKKQPEIDKNEAEIDKFIEDEEQLARRRRREAIDSLGKDDAQPA
jgi:multidrug efflux pump subunit AcrB